MEILEPAPPAPPGRAVVARRRLPPAGAGARLAGHPHGGRHAKAATLAALAALVLVVAWEIARPTLPVPFELAVAARSPGTASWLGRLPMAVASIGGSIALYIFLARTAERRAAAYAVAILATTPAWFVHARTMTGAIIPMACSVVVLASVGVAVGDRETGMRARCAAALVALVAASGAVVGERWGAPSRGIAVVAGAPVSAVGLAHLLWARGRPRVPVAVAAAVGIAILVAALLVAWIAPGSSAAHVLLGARSATAGAPAFDAPVASLAYGLVPWTPFVAFAIARRPTSVGHLAIMIAAVLTIAAHAALAPRTGTTFIVGIPFIAGALATFLRSLEDARRPSAGLVAGVLAIGWLVAHDVGLAPDRVLVAFGAADTAMAGAQAAASSLAIRSSLWLCMVLACMALVTPRSWLPAGRGLAVVAAGVFAGLVLRSHAYPELLARLSPGAAFDAWAERHRTGEPLGVVGLDRRAVAFAPGTAIVSHADAPSAGRWLASAPRSDSHDARRFLALASAELPRVNAEYRAVHAANAPVLAGQGSATLLAASMLLPGERSESPLDPIVLRAAPPSLHPLGAILEDRLEAVGWQLTDDRGRILEAVPRGNRSAHVRVFAAARDGARTELRGYCTFLHVEHSPSRFSAEHREHPYPMSLWRPGDVVVDDFDVKLPAQFRPGSYRMFWGVGVLPCEDDRRMHVTSGASDGHDRIPAGTLEVR